MITNVDKVSRKKNLKPCMTTAKNLKKNLKRRVIKNKVSGEKNLKPCMTTAKNLQKNLKRRVIKKIGSIITVTETMASNFINRVYIHLFPYQINVCKLY